MKRKPSIKVSCYLTAVALAITYGGLATSQEPSANDYFDEGLQEITRSDIDINEIKNKKFLTPLETEFIQEWNSLSIEERERLITTLDDGPERNRLGTLVRVVTAGTPAVRGAGRAVANASRRAVEYTKKEFYKDLRAAAVGEALGKAYDKVFGDEKDQKKDEAGKAQEKEKQAQAEAVRREEEAEEQAREEQEREEEQAEEARREDEEEARAKEKKAQEERARQEQARREKEERAEKEHERQKADMAREQAGEGQAYDGCQSTVSGCVADRTITNVDGENQRGGPNDSGPGSDPAGLGEGEGNTLGENGWGGPNDSSRSQNAAPAVRSLRQLGQHVGQVDRVTQSGGINETESDEMGKLVSTRRAANVGERPKTQYPSHQRQGGPNETAGTRNLLKDTSRLKRTRILIDKILKEKSYESSEFDY